MATRYAIVSEGVFLVSARKALAGEVKERRERRN